MILSLRLWHGVGTIAEGLACVMVTQAGYCFRRVINRKELKGMKFYETVFVVKYDASAAHVEAKAQECVGIIKSFGGDVTKTEFCGIKSLAYPIKKNKKGHYVLLNIISNSEGIAELERQLRLSEDILRFLSVKVDKLDNNPSPLMRKSFKDSQDND